MGVSHVGSWRNIPEDQCLAVEGGSHGGGEDAVLCDRVKSGAREWGGVRRPAGSLAGAGSAFQCEREGMPCRPC